MIINPCCACLYTEFSAITRTIINSITQTRINRDRQDSAGCEGTVIINARGRARDAWGADATSPPVPVGAGGDALRDFVVAGISQPYGATPSP